MTLVDTSPLVALCDPRDALHTRALRDLDRLGRSPFVVCAPIVTEACFLLPHAVQRQRIDRLLNELPMRPFVATDENLLWADVFQWLQAYADHAPDWADGYLAVVSGREKRAKVWTFDQEFRTTWRRLDGSRIPLVVR